MGVVPDKFVHLGVSQNQSLSRLKANCAEVNQSLYGKELDDVAMSLYREWEVNQQEVNSTFNNFIYFYDCNEKQQ